jgi:hypothetical protein
MKKPQELCPQEDQNPQMPAHSTLQLYSGQAFFAQGRICSGTSSNNVIYTILATFPSRKITRDYPFFLIRLCKAESIIN